MWRLLELLLLGGIILLSITEFFYPILTGNPLFGSFRKSKSAEPGSIDEKLTKAKEKVNEVKKVQTEVNDQVKDVLTKKEESDNLLK